MDNVNQNRKTHVGVGNLFITLLRKNRDKVDITLTDGRVLVGYIDAFDEEVIIVGVILAGQNSLGEVYVTRRQIVSINPITPKCYLNVI